MSALKVNQHISSGLVSKFPMKRVSAKNTLMKRDLSENDLSDFREALEAYTITKLDIKKGSSGKSSLAKLKALR